MSAILERGALLYKRYRIVEILGQGGMGSVYRAVDENLGVDVAVKENLFTTDEYARQFRLEAVILANLRHANLPRVTDHFVIPDQGQYLIMDYIDGEDLRQRMERTGSISEEEAILVGAAMCDALQYLHTRKPSIIHRDLKPGNVRITPDGHIYLVDFGLAKLVKGSQATTTGARAMTPGYSPPEQYGTARTGPRTDIYSLGATLYAVLSGVIPEDGLARAMDNIELTPLRKRNSKVSRKLASAIEKAMAVRPEDRFQSADEFRQALLTSNVKTQRLEGDLIIMPPVQTPEVEADNQPNKKKPAQAEMRAIPPVPSEPSRKVRIPRGWLFISLILMVIVLALLSILIFRTPITKAFWAIRGTSTTASTSTFVPIFSPATQTVPIVNTPLPATQTVPTVNTIPSATHPGSTVTVLPSLSATWTPLPTYEPPITPTITMTFGPTPTSLGGGGNLIAFTSDRTGVPEIFIMNADGSDPRPVTNMNYGACQPAWSPDGMRLVVVSPCPKREEQYPGAKLYIVKLDSSGAPIGLPSELPSIDGGDFDPAWSPDGTRIAFTSLRDGSRQIYVLNLGDNSVTALTELSSDKYLPDWSSQPAWSPSGTQIVYTGHSRFTDTPQIWLMSASGLGKKALILRGLELWNFLPDWSPDGKTILFGETQGAQQLGWLMLLNFESAKVDHLRTQAFGTRGNYSPDGLWVAYESKDSEDLNRSDYDIFRIQADGLGPITRLTNDTSMEFDPVWRPFQKPSK